MNCAPCCKSISNLELITNLVKYFNSIYKKTWFSGQNFMSEALELISSLNNIRINKLTYVLMEY